MIDQTNLEPEQVVESAEGQPGPEVSIGAIVHRLRRQRELSLEDLASASGVSAENTSLAGSGGA